MFGFDRYVRLIEGIDLEQLTVRFPPRFEKEHPLTGPKVGDLFSRSGHSVLSLSLFVGA